MNMHAYGTCGGYSEYMLGWLTLGETLKCRIADGDCLEHMCICMHMVYVANNIHLRRDAEVSYRRRSLHQLRKDTIGLIQYILHSDGVVEPHAHAHHVHQACC